MQRAILATVCALVIAIYVCAAHSGIPLSGRMGAADNYYNLLVQGFQVGQLSLKKEIPAGFASISDPYAPSAIASYFQEVGDMSYYRGKLYLYHGVTPAVVLFWPYAVLTGHYLLQRDAVVVFCLVGFLASAGLLWAFWRRYFAEVSIVAVAAGTLALGLATGVPVMLVQCKVNEVPISCGYALMSLALTAIWKASHESRKRLGWSAAASLAYGLALGARPSWLFGGVVLLVPVAQAWRERRPVLAPLSPAIVPLALVGLGLMLYNFLRFGRPFEFGLRYALSGDLQSTVWPFGLRYLWFHIRVYFLALAAWSSRFPFVHDIAVPPLPAGHGVVDKPFGVLTNIPVVWLAPAVPLAWQGRSAQTHSTLCEFLLAIAAVFGIAALTLSLFFSASFRYEVEFLPAMVLLAAVGILSVERTVADQPVWRHAACWGWSLLLGFSVVFNLLLSVGRCAEWHDDLGLVLERQGKAQEAIDQYEQALRLEPDFVQAHTNLGAALKRQGKVREAIGQYEQAVRVEPGDIGAHYDLGNALLQAGMPQEAIGHYEQALRLKPDNAAVHNNLAVALMGRGRLREAISHYEQVVRLTPDSAMAHYNLGVALEQVGRVQEAIQQYGYALRIKPDFVQAQNALARARAAQ